MRLRPLALIFITGLLSACAAHEGTYSPGCIAYAGDEITLANGEFTWQKFTDQVEVDEQGNVVNPFPGYPMRGNYRLEGETVHLQPASGSSIGSLHLHHQGGRHYLLTDEQLETLNKTGTTAACALVLGGRSND